MQRCLFHSRRLLLVAVLLLAVSPLYAGGPAPGQPIALALQTGRGKGNAFTLSGRDAGQQLIATANSADGRLCDLTRAVTYQATPAGIVAVDTTGYVSALQEGQATITARGPNGMIATATVTVTDLVRDVPVNFPNDVVPIFTRLGCNGGGCHGKSGGQNGFQLSLLGFEPAEDYEYLVKEARGRRVFPAAPEASLLLLKATGKVPHGGGSPLKADSAAYRLLRRWIEQGTPYGKPTDPVVTHLTIFPGDRVLASGTGQQLAVAAHYSDGSTRDVTRLSQFESNEPGITEVSPTGLVGVKLLTGIAAVMVRFQSHVATFRATVPCGAEVSKLPPARNFIDELVFKQFKALGLPPSPICDDATFLRRVTLDLAGRLPTVQEVEEFLADTAADKRVAAVDRLLASPDYADYFANKWRAVLRNKRDNPKNDAKPTAAFHAWIRDSLHANKPFDQFVRGILTATGEEVQNPPVAWYREVKDVFSQVEDTAQLFLGTRLQCARCHHHPQEKWSQQDYYSFAAFFAQVGYQLPPKADVKQGDKKPKDAPRVPVHVIVRGRPVKLTNPRTGMEVFPTPLGGEPLVLPAGADPRLALADWIVSPENHYFARALVNRYWKHFFGRGLVDPEDDLRATNPPTNPELLNALARHFVEHKYDLKDLVRTICTSTVYQLSAVPNAHNKSDRQNYSHFYVRPLPAEVLFDAIDQVTLAKPQFPGVPAGTRAVQLPDNAFESYFLVLFGRPDGSSACECERSSEFGLAQVLHLMNSHEVLAKVSGMLPKAPAKGKNDPKAKLVVGERLATLLADKRPAAIKIRELYLAAFSREPTAAEAQLLLAHLDRHRENPRAAYEDILWVLINAEEFLFNH
jgi:hypothetical protein